jgi:hypothetical protein
MLASSQPKANIGKTPFSKVTTASNASFVSRSNHFFDI